jgi:hypothetical protein
MKRAESHSCLLEEQETKCHFSSLGNAGFSPKGGVNLKNEQKHTHRQIEDYKGPKW